MTYAMLNDRQVKPEECLVSIFDLGFSRGLTVFELLRTYNEEPCFLDEHIDRLFISAKEMGLDLNLSKFEITNRVEKLLEKRRGRESMIKLVATASQSSHRLLPTGFANLFVIVSDVTQLDPSLAEKGLRLRSVKVQRMHPQIKSTNYAPAVKEIIKGQAEGYDDILYTQNDGLICESSTSNIFFIQGNRLYTPKKEILKGITRQAMIDNLPDEYSCKEVDIYIEDLADFDEAFLTSSIKEILPVSQIDDQPFNSCHPKSVSRAMTRLYHSLFQATMAPLH